MEKRHYLADGTEISRADLIAAVRAGRMVMVSAHNGLILCSALHVMRDGETIEDYEFSPICYASEETWAIAPTVAQALAL